MSDNQAAPTASFQLILDTAERLIQEKGCRQTTLQDIIDRSGLSKGAIYHYVSGKDELFGLVLKARVEQINTKFNKAVAEPGDGGLAAPLQTIAEGMAGVSGQQDVTNKIFIYLLGQMDNPKVAELVRGIYRYSIDTAARWVAVGQESGVIPPSVDGSKIAQTFITMMYGQRVQNAILPEEPSLGLQDFFNIMFRSLSGPGQQS